MYSRNRYPGVASRTLSTVRFHANRLASHRCFTSADREDFEQEFMLVLHQRMSKFNPTLRAKNAFVNRLVRNRAATLLERSLAQKRGGGITIISLHELVWSPGRSVELMEILSNEHALWPTLWSRGPAVMELRLDYLIRQKRRGMPRTKTMIFSNQQ